MNRLGSADTVQVVKFHGDLEFPNHMVVSELNITSGGWYWTRRWTIASRQTCLGRVVLFMGYSFKDWNVSYLFRLINERFNQLQGALSGRRAFITVADPSDFEREMFSARNMEVIAVRGEDQTGDIATLLEEMRQ